MQCPNCQTNISKHHALCPRCDWQLQSQPMPATVGDQFHNSQHYHSIHSTKQYSNNTHLNTATIPLTGAQKIRLFNRNSLTLVIILLLLVVGISSLGISGAVNFYWVLLSIVALIIGKKAILDLKDVISGVAVVQTTRLLKMQLGADKDRRGYYGYFEHVGLLNIDAQLYDEAFQDILYQITYSPQSKRLWTMKRVD